MNNNKNKERSSGYIFILLFIILSAGIIAVGCLYYLNYKKHYRAGVEEQLTAIAELKVAELVQYRNERLGDAGILYKNETFTALIRSFFKQPENKVVQKQIQSWLTKYRDHFQYNNTILFDKKGVIKISAPEDSIQIDSTLSQHINEVISTGQIKIVDFYRNEEKQRIFLTTLIPILDNQNSNRVIAVLALRIDPEKFLYPFIKRWPTSSRTAETLLIRKDGNDALFLNELRFGENAALNLRIPLNRKEVPAVKAVLGQRGIVTGIDYRGAPVIACIRSVPGSPWFIVARVDLSEINMPLKEQFREIVFLVCILIFGTGASLAFVSRQQGMRFYKEKHKAAAALQKISARQEALLSAIPDIITEVDYNKVITWTNSAGFEFFGDDVIGKDASFYFEGEQDTYKTVQPVFNGNDKVIYVESWQRRRDGQKRLLAWWCRALKDKNGDVIGALSSARDLTDRMLAENALIESEEKFRALFENMVEGVAIHEIVYDDSGNPSDYRIISLNPAFERHTGISLSLAKGALATKLYGTNTPPFFNEYVTVAITRQPINFEVYFQPLEKHFIISVISPKQGQFATIFEDITELKNKAKELQDKNDELARFTYTVSHDLKSPLVTVKTFLGFLEQDTIKNDKVRIEKDFTFIRNAADKMSRLLDELLELSRVGRKMNPSVEVSLQNLVKESMELVAGRIAEKNVTVTVTEEPILLFGDRPRLVEIFQNLIDNAVKFMGEQQLPLVEIGVEHEDDEIILYVRDNGIGIDPRHKHKLFGLFEKLNPGAEGTGIGLALVKRIVELHKGRVWGESEGLGKGATFRFTLAKTKQLDL